jgi:hypothetical protein
VNLEEDLEDDEELIWEETTATTDATTTTADVNKQHQQHTSKDHFISTSGANIHNNNNATTNNNNLQYLNIIKQLEDENKDLKNKNKVLSSRVSELESSLLLLNENNNKTEVSINNNQKTVFLTSAIDTTIDISKNNSKNVENKKKSITIETSSLSSEGSGVLVNKNNINNSNFENDNNSQIIPLKVLKNDEKDVNNCIHIDSNSVLSTTAAIVSLKSSSVEKIDVTIESYNIENKKEEKKGNNNISNFLASLDAEVDEEDELDWN